MKKDAALAIRCHRWKYGPWMMGVKSWTQPKSQLWILIQCSPRFLLLLPLIKACVIWESIETIESLRIHSHNNIRCSLRWFFNLDFMKKNMKDFHFRLTPTHTIVSSTNLKTSRKKYCKMWEASKVHQIWIKGLTWNGAFITTTMLHCMVTLKELDCMLIALVNKIDS